MITVFKYEIPAEASVVIDLPEGARVLCVGTQLTTAGEGLYLWAECDTSATLKPRRFCVVGTGYPLVSSMRIYVGTAHFKTAALVVHVYTDE